MRLFTPLWLATITVVVMPPNCPGRNAQVVELPFAFEYQRHLGLDCYQKRDCGYRFEVAADGVVRRHDDKGQMTFTGESKLSAELADRLVELFAEVGFDDLPEKIPPGPSSAGRTTVTVTVKNGDGSSKTVVANMEDEHNPVGPAFAQFDYELRKVLREVVPDPKRPTPTQ